MARGFLGSVYDGTKHVDLNSEYWVKIRMMKTSEIFSLNESPGTDTEKTTRALAASIVEWNLDDEHGTLISLPADPVFLLEWPQSMYAKLAEAVAASERADASFRGEAPGLNLDGGYESGAADLSAVRNGNGILAATGAEAPVA